MLLWTLVAAQFISDAHASWCHLHTLFTLSSKLAIHICQCPRVHAPNVKRKSGCLFDSVCQVSDSLTCIGQWHPTFFSKTGLLAGNKLWRCSLLTTTSTMAQMHTLAMVRAGVPKAMTLALMYRQHSAVRSPSHTCHNHSLLPQISAKNVTMGHVSSDMPLSPLSCSALHDCLVCGHTSQNVTSCSAVRRIPYVQAAS